MHGQACFEWHVEAIPAYLHAAPTCCILPTVPRYRCMWRGRAARAVGSGKGGKCGLAPGTSARPGCFGPWCSDRVRCCRIRGGHGCKSKSPHLTMVSDGRGALCVCLCICASVHSLQGSAHTGASVVMSCLVLSGLVGSGLCRCCCRRCPPCPALITPSGPCPQVLCSTYLSYPILPILLASALLCPTLPSPLPPTHHPLLQLRTLCMLSALDSAPGPSDCLTL